jgi:argininosuccinate synthase
MASAPKHENRVVLAYSGGLDTSVIIPWLQENHGLEVHCLAGNVGQGDHELEGLEEKAKATGAASCKVADVRTEFVEDCIWPCLRAMAVYEGRYLLGTSMARPVLAKAQVDYAHEVGAAWVAHGCTGKGNDQVRFELGYRYLDPTLKVIAPWRSWEITSPRGRDRLRRTAPDPDRRDEGQDLLPRRQPLAHQPRRRRARGAGQQPPDDVWMWTVDPREAPDEPRVVTIGIEQGVPTSIDGKNLDPVTLVRSSMRSRPSTASAASTSPRTGWSA